MITDAQLRKASYQGVLSYPVIENPDSTPYAAKYIRSKELAMRGVFIKPGEEPDKAIKRFMGRLKPKAPSRSFPKSFKTTADYFAMYAFLNSNAVCLDFKNLSTTGFAIPEGDEVIYEEVEPAEECCDLI